MRKTCLAVSALALSAPAFAQGNAADGLQAMRELNLIVLGDMRAGHDVEGKTFVGGDFLGNAPLGIGNSKQGAAASTRRTLTVGGNASGNINLNNGPNGAGGGNVATTPGVLIGGDLGSANFNMAGAAVDVGGDFGGNLNLSNGQVVNIGGRVTGSINGSGSTQTVKAGGSINGNANGALFMPNLGLGWNAAATSVAVAAETAKLTADVRALSKALSALTVKTPSVFDTADFNNKTLRAVDGGSGFALFNVQAADFGGGTLVYDFASSTLPVIINVLGSGTINWGINAPAGGAGANQQVIWNFGESITGVNFGTMVHGSVLAPWATISNQTPIEGSVVAAAFNQNGEVHLGTYDLTDRFLLREPPPPGVPEPATWAMMILGFGLVGMAMRRRAAMAI